MIRYSLPSGPNPVDCRRQLSGDQANCSSIAARQLSLAWKLYRLFGALALLVIAFSATALAQPKITISAPASVRGGDPVPVDVQVENLAGIEAFGFELRFNENLLTYDSITGVQKGALTQGFASLLANKFTIGSIRVGGYSLTPTQTGSGILCRFPFTAKRGVEDSLVLDIRSLVDFPQTPMVVPALISVQREPLPNSSISAGDARGRRGRMVVMPVEAVLPNGSSVRGASTQIIYDSSILDYAATAQADPVPSGYSATGESPAPGTLNLGLGGGSADLSSGDLWKVQFQIKPNAAYGRSAVALIQAASFFLVNPGNTQVSVPTTRDGSVSVFPAGDANHSGTVTTADVITVVLASLYGAYANEFTDCNLDGQTNSLDITCTIKALFGRTN